MFKRSGVVTPMKVLKKVDGELDVKKLKKVLDEKKDSKVVKGK